MTENRRRIAGYLVALGVLVIDQLTKFLALSGLELHRPVEVLGDLLRFTLAWNRGAAFSLGWGGPVVLTVITGAAAVFVAVLIWRLNIARRYLAVTMAFGAVLGGALGNLLDRIFHGEVLDFIDVGLGTKRWPTFNVADIAIVVGGVLLILTYRRTASRDHREDSSE